MSQNPSRDSVDISHARSDHGARESMFTIFNDRRGQVSEAQTIADSFSPPIELDQLINPDEVFQKQLPLTPKFVKWGVQWHKEPTYMLLFALGGLLLGIGHHCYYNSLSGTEAGSNQRQQWAHNFGNIFAVLVVTALHRANGYAYSQLFWCTVRGRSFRLGSLDKLFSLTTDPMGFFNLEIFRHASFAVALAIVCWSIGLAGILPPGTLVVVSGTVNQVTKASFPVLNWNSSSWVGPLDSTMLQTRGWILTRPTELVLDIAAQSAVTMDVLRFSPPAPNSSYTLQVQGPYLKCDKANGSRQPIFDYYTHRLATDKDNTNFTPSDDTAINQLRPISMLYFSAFDSILGVDEWTNEYANSESTWDQSTDQYNNLSVDLPSAFTDSLGYNAPDRVDEVNAGAEFMSRMVPRQLWVRTADSSIICTLGNATREVNFQFVDAVQTISYGEVQSFTPLFVPRTGHSDGLRGFDLYPYVAVYLGLTTLLSGNIPTLLWKYEIDSSCPVQHTYQTALADSSSRILLTGLVACQDFNANTWINHSIERYEGDIMNNLLPKQPSLCRNHTLERAIEDLAANITISMMTSSALTSISKITTTIYHFPTRNLYHYNSLYLLLSYGLAFLFTALSIGLGLYTFHTNGVIHASTFSSIITTTRNGELDEISKGSSLGNLTLDKELKMLRLRFGAIDTDGKFERAGFGVGDKVGALKKGGRYV
ncbi:hypothetical protein LSUB1_G007637 [Lachnellula subtilissima]|uniref:Uncharacterized protein n=1 Tax=Lachnellula subtilissima TaxID=602034 RepID=A0A8H8RDH2_9HELO|nr:hypothetical protein LSUB1_G007637 [Lachnellula subtilissima]